MAWWTVRFDAEQRFNAAPDRVMALYTDASYYEGLPELAKVGRPKLVSRTGDEQLVTLRIHYRFTADLPSAAHAVIDADKLTWIEETVFDVAGLTTRSRLVPDHYPDRLTASASSVLAPDPGNEGGTVRKVRGELKVRVAFVGGKVERAIVDGLRDHLAAEAAHMNQRLTA